MLLFGVSLLTSFAYCLIVSIMRLWPASNYACLNSCMSSWRWSTIIWLLLLPSSIVICLLFCQHVSMFVFCCHWRRYCTADYPACYWLYMRLGGGSLYPSTKVITFFLFPPSSIFCFEALRILVFVSSLLAPIVSSLDIFLSPLNLMVSSSLKSEGTNCAESKQFNKLALIIIPAVYFYCSTTVAMSPGEV